MILRSRVTPNRIIISSAAAILSPEKTIKVSHLLSPIHDLLTYSVEQPSWITLSWNYYSSQARPGSPISHGLREKTSPPGQSVESKRENDVGKNVSNKDKIKFLVNTLLDLKESKEAVYGALDAWVAWEQRFPIASLRIALTILEKDQEWHKVIQVIKWMLSKGQGNTMGIYRQLINALDKDHRAEEAHNFWMKKIGSDFHSVPWQLCTLMISIYYRNNMPERLVKLFKGLEAFDRKLPQKAVVQKVADAYELLGLVEDKNRVLEKYNSLFTETWRGHPKNSKKASRKKAKESAENNKTRASHSEQSNTYDAQLDSSDKKISKEDVQVTSYSQHSNINGVIDVVRQMIQS